MAASDFIDYFFLRFRLSLAFFGLACPFDGFVGYAWVNCTTILITTHWWKSLTAEPHDITHPSRLVASRVVKQLKTLSQIEFITNILWMIVSGNIFFTFNLPQTPSNMISFTISLTLRPFTQFKPKIQATKVVNKC